MYCGKYALRDWDDRQISPSTMSYKYQRRAHPTEGSPQQRIDEDFPALFFCGSRRLSCLYSSSSHRWSPIWWPISWQVNHDSKANPSCCGPSGGVWGRVLLLRRALDTQGTAASRQFFCGRSYASEGGVQRFSIHYPRCFNAVAHLSLLLAGGLSNGTIATRNQ